MVGSSWKSPDSSGLAPTMSPAAAVIEYGWPLRAVAQVRRQVLDTARVDVFVVPSAWSLGDLARRAGRRLQVAVQVVEGQQLDVDGSGRLAVAGGRAGRRPSCARARRASRRPARRRWQARPRRRGSAGVRRLGVFVRCALPSVPREPLGRLRALGVGVCLRAA